MAARFTRNAQQGQHDIAMCDGKIIHRWNGPDSHWIVGSTREINGRNYKLVDIVVTTGVNFLTCKEVPKEP